MKNDEKRRYDSPLRVAQAAQTRERIVSAALELLQKDESPSLTLPKVAQAAGVSVPTAYAHYPTQDELCDSILESLAAKLQVSDGRQANLVSLRDLPAQSFKLYAKNAKTLRALLASPAARHLDRIWGPEAQRQWLTSTREAAPNLLEGQQRAQAALLSALCSPTLWLWLTETCGLSENEAVESATWAIETLFGALSEGAAARSPKVPRAKDSQAASGEHEEPEPTPSWLL